MIEGHHIDIDTITNITSQANIIIAHHAGFDRPFCEKLWAGFQDIPWGCSLSDIDWKGQGMESMKLSALASAYGFFYEGHRALIDCQVGIEILSRSLPKTEQTALQALLTHARQTHVRLWAENAPFDSKDILKQRGYRWNALKKTWYIDLSEDKIEVEIIKLNRDVYPSERSHFPMEYFDAKKRYSGRV
jgi:DNA polymerase III subunit epsilon